MSGNYSNFQHNSHQAGRNGGAVAKGFQARVAMLYKTEEKTIKVDRPNEKKRMEENR